MTFSELVQRRMFLLMIFAIVLFGYWGGIESVGINQTVGWRWDITSWFYYIKRYFLPVYMVGYGILALLQYWTHKYLSIIHLILVILIFVFDDLVSLDIRIVVVLNIISMLVFLLNIIWAIRNRTSKQ